MYGWQPKRFANKVKRLTWDPKLNKPLPYNPTEVLIPQNTKNVGLYVSGLFNLVSTIPTLTSRPCSHIFWVLTSLHLLFLLKMFFYYCCFHLHFSQYQLHWSEITDTNTKIMANNDRYRLLILLLVHHY